MGYHKLSERVTGRSVECTSEGSDTRFGQGGVTGYHKLSGRFSGMLVAYSSEGTGMVCFKYLRCMSAAFKHETSRVNEPIFVLTIIIHMASATKRK